MSHKRMTLRRKLSAAFAGLVAVALLAAGVASYATLRWQATASDMETHYQRSLLLERVRAGTYQALKEVDDALTGDHVDAQGDFDRALAPVTRDFELWAQLADTHAEQGEIARVREAHQRLIENARRVFALIPADRAEALRLADDEVDTGDYERFRQVTEGAVEDDQRRRQLVQAETERLRTTTQIMLAVAALSILSLAFLIAAYLTHDLFTPLRDLARTAERLSLGDVKARADEDREDEIGKVGRALNALAASIERRARDLEATGDAPTELHALVAALQAKVRELRTSAHGTNAATLTEVEHLADAVVRTADVGFPIDLDLEPVDLAALVHDVVSRFRRELAERVVSLELNLSDALEPVLADRLKVREALCEAVRNALDALPDNGGRIGFRAYGADGVVRVEVADNGRGMDANLLERALEENGPRPGGLVVARAIAERHGGALALFSEPGKGTVAQFTLPDRAG